MGDPTLVRAALTEIAQGPAKATVRDFATHLGRLALHFWRPDFTPEQAKVQYGDFIRLLDGMTADELRDACDAWLMDPDNKFFPNTPGQLSELVRWRLSQRKMASDGAKYLLDLTGESSPAPGSRDARAMLKELSDKMKAR